VGIRYLDAKSRVSGEGKAHDAERHIMLSLTCGYSD
jgi:hypothetical protein